MEHYFTNNENLKSEIRSINYKYKDYTLTFLSDNGVFSKNQIDFGSRSLVETFLASKDKEYDSILDIGCGYGFIGITLGKILNKHIDMCDINKRAMHLAKRNIDANKVDASVFESDIYEGVNKKYDLIITNPPIRVGKEILYKFLDESKDHLTSDGELWFVIHKDQGAKSTVKHLENSYFCEIINKNKGFYIIKAKKR